MAKKITMAELAREANVDVSTVSRALNDSPLVKPHTKEHILKIADEMGYAINVAARNLRKQSSGTLGIVIPMNPETGQTISDPFFLEMVGAVSHAASQAGYDLIISVPPSESEIAERRLLMTGRADGLIVIGQAGRSERLNASGVADKNIIVWGGQDEAARYVVIGSDNVKGGFMAAEHLLSLGRRNILFLGDTQLPEVKLRYDGYLKAHKAVETPINPNLVLRESFGGQTVFDAVCDFFEEGHDVDAVMAASDVLAMSAIHAIRSLGLRVPEDIPVVGYDNVGQAELFTPALTTIDQNIAEGGRLMVEMLLDKIAGKPVASTTTPMQLIVRQSCGAKLNEG